MGTVRITECQKLSPSIWIMNVSPIDAGLYYHLIIPQAPGLKQMQLFFVHISVMLLDSMETL